MNLKIFYFWKGRVAPWIWEYFTIGIPIMAAARASKICNYFMQTSKFCPLKVSYNLQIFYTNIDILRE